MSLETNALEVDQEEFVDELKPGTKLMLGQYTIEDFLAAGGFGITYLARDSLNRLVVIKECFPGSFCRRQNTSVTPRSRAHQNELKSIVRLFSQEAMSLAKTNHPNIVGVHQVFEENNTAYMALDYVQGRDLLEILQDDPDSLRPDLVEGYLRKILDAIKHIHNLGMLHRDISPDNIIINEQGEPILIDFGAARESANPRVTRMLSALRVVKDGYSPQEFYIAGSEQTPSCDLYSLAASFYHLITRELPPDSQWRLSACAAGDEDPYVSLGEKTNDYSKGFVSALDKAMSVLPRDRMQSAEEWLAHMSEDAAVAADSGAKKTAPSSATTEEKKSFMPVLLGTTALAAAVGAGFFYLSTSGTEAPTDSLVEEEVAVATEAPVAAPFAVEVDTTETAEAAPAEATQQITGTPLVPPQGTDVAGAETAPAAVAPEPIEEAAAADEAPAPVAQEPELATVTEIAIDIAEPPVPAVEETTDFEVAPIILALPEQMAIPQPRPFRDAASTVAGIDEDLPVVDTVAPDAPETQAPNVVAAAEPSRQVENSAITEATLDFFLSMSTSEPDLVSTRPARAESERAPARVAAAPAENPSVITRFVPVMPFTLSQWTPGLVTSVTEDSPSWLTVNSRIVSIEGQPVASNEDIKSTLDALATQDDASAFEVTVAMDTGLNTAVTERQLSIRKERHTLLLNGLRFVSREHDTGWVTEVTEVPGTSNFKVGDTLVSYVSTWENVDGPDSLQTILNRELASGTSSFSFAVSRNGEIWIEAFNLASLN